MHLFSQNQSSFWLYLTSYFSYEVIHQYKCKILEEFIAWWSQWWWIVLSIVLPVEMSWTVFLAVAIAKGMLLPSNTRRKCKIY